MRSANSFAAANSSSLSGSISIRLWKFPSPTCPIMGAKQVSEMYQTYVAIISYQQKEMILDLA